MPDRPSTPYREDLCRSATFELRADPVEVDDGLTIDGYGAVFNSVTQIDSWEGAFDEVIAPGAFKKSLRERTPLMQFDHGHHPLLGSLPLGRWTTTEEDPQGLHLIGRLTDNWLVQPFRDAIRDGGVTGMSFRFSVVREDWTDASGKKIADTELADLLWYGAGDRGPILRTLKELRVSEAGPVTWPAYADTSVGVRSASTVIDLGRIDVRDPAGRAQLARAVALADAASARPLERPAAAPPISTGQTPGDARTEPPSTAAPAADGHATQAPPVTAGAAAGGHPSARARRDRMRAESLRIQAAMSTIKS